MNEMTTPLKTLPGPADRGFVKYANVAVAVRKKLKRMMMRNRSVAERQG